MEDLRGRQSTLLMLGINILATVRFLANGWLSDLLDGLSWADCMLLHEVMNGLKVWSRNRTEIPLRCPH